MPPASIICNTTVKSGSCNLFDSLAAHSERICICGLQFVDFLLVENINIDLFAMIITCEYWLFPWWPNKALNTAINAPCVMFRIHKYTTIEAMLRYLMCKVHIYAETRAYGQLFMLFLRMYIEDITHTTQNTKMPDVEYGCRTCVWWSNDRLYGPPVTQDVCRVWWWRRMDAALRCILRFRVYFCTLLICG